MHHEINRDQKKVKLTVPFAWPSKFGLRLKGTPSKAAGREGRERLIQLPAVRNPQYVSCV